MREYVAILYRGSSYELGRGVRFYGIWPAGLPQPQPQPIEWWPESPEGWAGAWARFTGSSPARLRRSARTRARPRLVRLFPARPRPARPT